MVRRAGEKADDEKESAKMCEYRPNLKCLNYKCVSLGLNEKCFVNIENWFLCHGRLRKEFVMGKFTETI